MEYAVEVKKLAPQPAVAVHRDITMAQIPEAMQQGVPATWSYAESHGGRPTRVYARYFAVEPENVSMDVGVILEQAIDGEGEIRATELPSGDAAFVLYVGPYPEMEAAYRAIEVWVRENGREAGGGAWEVYLTDPQAEPDPAKWQTEIYWPLK